MERARGRRGERRKRGAEGAPSRGLRARVRTGARGVGVGASAAQGGGGGVRSLARSGDHHFGESHGAGDRGAREEADARLEAAAGGVGAADPPRARPPLPARRAPGTEGRVLRLLRALRTAADRAPARLTRKAGEPRARPARRARGMKIGITCYPTHGGSGVVATELGMELAKRGHEVHFISYQVPFRLNPYQENVTFHEVQITSYPLFQYPPYTLALAAKMAEVADEVGLEVLHAHYAIPHAICGYLARQIAKSRKLRLVTTLHGTDITLVGSDQSFRSLT